MTGRVVVGAGLLGYALCGMGLLAPWAVVSGQTQSGLQLANACLSLPGSDLLRPLRGLGLAWYLTSLATVVGGAVLVVHLDGAARSVRIGGALSVVAVAATTIALALARHVVHVVLVGPGLCLVGALLVGASLAWSARRDGSATTAALVAR